MRTPRQVFVVSHTHWDREWYQTFQQFRVQLNAAVRRVLDALEHDDAFHHFLLDGQTVILEDHLAVHPEDRERIRALNESGRLSLGPWYILPDELIVGAEATVRNLLLGHRVAAEFGGAQTVGYMPDSFGHIAQMPQLLRGAGIDSFVYTRGNGDEIDRLGHEFVWEAPDGSSVLAINQCKGYCNAGGLGYEELWHAHTRREVDVGRAVEQVRTRLEEMDPGSRTSVRLLNNGCDHFPPQRDLGPILEALRAEFPQTEFVHCGLREFVDAVRQESEGLERFRGELIQGKLHHILSGVWSARMPLKQQNERCETLLAAYLEPIAVHAHFRHGQEYPASAIEQAWKTLLLNHPHDSICGCSIDAVHREMEVRFASVVEAGEKLLHRHLEALAPMFGRRPEHDRGTVLCVANPLPARRTEVVERMMVLQPFGLDIEDLELLDESGQVVPFRVLERRYVERFWGVDYRAELRLEDQERRFAPYAEHFGTRILRDASRRDESDVFATIQFLARDLPALGHANYVLRERSGASDVGPDPGGSVVVAGNSVENEFYRVTLHPDGRFDLEDRRNGRVLRDLNVLEDEADVGDEYDFSPLAGDCPVRTFGRRGSVRSLRDGGLRGSLEAEFCLPLPSAIAADRQSRRPDVVDCRTRVRVGLDHGSPLVRVEVSFDNRAGDHRLCAVFPTGIRSDELLSDGHFHVNRRPLDQPAGDDWVQAPPGTFPQQGFSAVEGDGAGVALLNRGLPEIRASVGEVGGVSLKLTLLRSVEWLSRDDFASRRFSNAGPTLHTPDAQCYGEHVFRYGLALYRGGWLEAGIHRFDAAFRTPPVTVQGVEDGLRPGGESFLRSTSPSTIVSAVKRHADRDTVIVRLCNLADREVSETLRLGMPIEAAWRVDLLERRLGEIETVRECEVSLELGPHEVATVEIAVRSPIDDN